MCLHLVPEAPNKILPRNSMRFTVFHPPMKSVLIPLFLAAAVASSFGQGRRTDNAPALGAPIPKISAKTPDGKSTVVLNEPKRLTVLVFGSHT